jgi:uncharacterized protein (TIGR00645 family)
MTKPAVERFLERGLFASRWLMAPMYVGLVIALAALVVIFIQELVHVVPVILSGGAHAEDAILLALSLIDLSLAGNLVLIVIFSGYENFVSKLDIGETVDRPSWMGTVDFSGLKMKLVASIVAISAIALLKAFLVASESKDAIDTTKMLWLVVIHLTFVASGVLLAVMDWVASLTDKH